jgi:hypothetical protein
MKNSTAEQWTPRLGEEKHVLRLFPEDHHSAVIMLTEAVRFLPDVHTLEIVVLQQMIATVFKLDDSIEFKIAERAHPRLV